VSGPIQPVPRSVPAPRPPALLRSIVFLPRPLTAPLRSTRLSGRSAPFSAPLTCSATDTNRDLHGEKNYTPQLSFPSPPVTLATIKRIPFCSGAYAEFFYWTAGGGGSRTTMLRCLMLSMGKIFWALQMYDGCKVLCKVTTKKGRQKIESQLCSSGGGLI